MADKEKLIWLLCNAHSKSCEASAFDGISYAEQLAMEADFLLENGVTFAKDTNAVRSAWTIDEIENAPEVDAVEVVHGRWEVDEFGHYCTACREYGPEIEGDIALMTTDPFKWWTPPEMADHLISHGVTIAPAVPGHDDQYNIAELSYNNGYAKGLEDGKPKWIPGKNLPKVWKHENGDSINFLAVIPGFGVDIANWIEPVHGWFCLGIPCKVTHWMPLPEPPKEEYHCQKSEMT